MKPTKKKKEWTYDNYLKGHIRKIWRWSPKRRHCLKATSCQLCKAKNVTLFADHIDPVVDPRKGFVDWNTYIHRMFSGELQAICRKCHTEKTKAEMKLRREFKK